MPERRGFIRAAGGVAKDLGVGVGLAVDGIKTLSAWTYNDLNPHGLWNEVSETVTLTGNHVTRIAVEAPPNAPGVALNLLGIAALLYVVYRGVQVGRSVGEFVRPRSSKSTRRSGTTS